MSAIKTRFLIAASAALPGVAFAQITPTGSLPPTTPTDGNLAIDSGQSVGVLMALLLPAV
ncbi:MAG: hypothetical protein AAFR38_07875 [Planctomycetota bacterium]